MRGSHARQGNEEVYRARVMTETNLNKDRNAPTIAFTEPDEDGACGGKTPHGTLISQFKLF